LIIEEGAPLSVERYPPLKVTVPVRVTFVRKSKYAPPLTVTAADASPSALADVARTRPPEIVVPPLWLLLPLKVSVPLADLTSDPLPLIAPDKVWLAEVFTRKDELVETETAPL
jgi:hypothetical protein